MKYVLALVLIAGLGLMTFGYLKRQARQAVMSNPEVHQTAFRKQSELPSIAEESEMSTSDIPEPVRAWFPPSSEEKKAFRINFSDGLSGYKILLENSDLQGTHQELLFRTKPENAKGIWKRGKFYSTELSALATIISADTTIQVLQVQKKGQKNQIELIWRTKI